MKDIFKYIENILIYIIKTFEYIQIYSNTLKMQHHLYIIEIHSYTLAYIKYPLNTL
jgi:hypothetical protein